MMWSAAFTALLSAGAALIAAVVGAFLGRRSSREANATDRFKAFNAALETRCSKLEERVGILETALDAMKESLATEQSQHAKTQELLRVALRHIRDVVAWAAGDQVALIPQPPPELLGQL